MNLTYRTRRNLQRGGIIALIVLLVSVLIWGCWLVWVERHIVYTRSGAVIDFGVADRDHGEGELAVAPEDREAVSVYYNDGSDLTELDVSLRQLRGYYIDADMLSGDLDTLRAAIDALPVGSAVMMEVKSIRGNFYYSTGIDGAPTASDMDIEAIDRLIAEIAEKNLYFIASAPALRDRNFGLENIACGLPFIGGQGALWLDESGCYWLDPTKSGTMEYLMDIAGELEDLGFDEVVFTDFRFPDTAALDFTANKVTAIQNAAATLVTECATDRFAVSFLASDSTVKAVSGRSRLYLTGVEVEDADSTVAVYTVEDPAVNLVFITSSYDTRYDVYSVLRPLDSAVPG